MGRAVTHHVLPESSVLQKFIPESLHRRHPPRRQHRFPGAQLLIFQPSPSQLSQLLQPQFLVGRIPRHVAADTKAAGDGAHPNQGLVTYARSRSAKRPCEDAWERRAVITSLCSCLRATPTSGWACAKPCTPRRLYCSKLPEAAGAGAGPRGAGPRGAGPSWPGRRALSYLKSMGGRRTRGSDEEELVCWILKK